MFKKLALSVSFLLMPVALNAAVTINLTGLALLNDAAGDPLPVNRPVFLVADTGSDGFGSVLAGTYGLEDSIDAAGNDKIVSIFDFQSGFDAFSSEGAAEHSVTFDETMFGGSGISLAVFWFDTPHVGTDANVGPGIQVTLASGTAGNLYDPNSSRVDAGAVDGSDEWQIPSAGGTSGLNFLTVSTTAGTQPNALGNSVGNFVVPEPSSLLSLALGCLFLLRRRR